MAWSQFDTYMRQVERPLRVRLALLGIGLVVAVVVAVVTAAYREVHHAGMNVPHAMLQRLVVIGLLLLVAATTGIWLLSAALVRPIDSLVDAANAISGGDNSRRANIVRRDELGALARAFNTMVERITAAEERYRTLFDLNPQPMWVVDAASQGFLAVNRAAVLQYGYTRREFEGMRMSHIRTADAAPHHRTKDGRVFPVEVTSERLQFEGRDAWLVVSTDLTQRREAEKLMRSAQNHLLQAQKMEAVGRLAGGVAHDFNNLLTVILGEGGILRRDPKLDLAARTEAIDAIVAAGERGALLTRQLLTFSRRHLVEATPMPINDVVIDIEQMLRRLIAENIHLVFRLDPAAGVVAADRGQLEQVLVNLVVNARDAMPDGGTLTVETSRAFLDDGYADVHHEVTPGEYVLVTVSDTGSGMTDEVKSHLFEPFFTTKERGKGTGLGLATSYAIVRQGGGHLTAYSECGIGTTMRVYLPLVADRQARMPTPPHGRPVVTGDETILVVEDEAAVRKVAKRLLEKFGYTVQATETAEEAIAWLERSHQPIDLLLTDVVLPGMGGRDLADRVAQLRPGTPVLFASGYSNDEILRGKLRDHDVTLLHKPFNEETLGAKVREAIDRGERTKVA